ncbi:MAG: ceramidase domain-containing protein [Xanthobacteraceae bacterium]|nr:ceramidase domain-containing protein [Xanthobacteraceae bacterium]
MSIAAAIRARPLTCLFGLAGVSLAGLLLVPPLPQSQVYHGFADQRTIWGIPNFWCVVSNLPFILVGALGLVNVRHDLSARVFFLGVFLTGFTSSYYHWAPSDWGLFWDRLPMTFAFMAILANVIGERVDERAGKLLLWPLVALGVASLLVWLRFDDLRFYAWVQFFPFIVLPLMLWLLPPKYTGTWLWFVAAGFYVLAKLLEHYDAAIYSALGIMSGHPIKHVAAATAAYAIYLAFVTRKPTSGSGP